MFKKIILVILPLFLIIGICLVSTYFLLRFFIDKEERIHINGGFYSINPDTILEDFSQGKTDVFTPQEDLPDEKSREYVQWKLADYDLIAQVLHELAWEEPLEEWKMSLISFDWDCEYIDKGPQGAHFRYFKVEKLRERKSRFVSELFVNPLENMVNVSMWEHYPRLCCWDVIDLAKLGVSADEALDIAEKNGGAEARAAVGNICQIHVVLNPASPRYGGWNVRYSYLGTIDQYIIDPKTGEVVAKWEEE
jgi:hypothetical protein